MTVLSRGLTKSLVVLAVIAFHTSYAKTSQSALKNSKTTIVQKQQQYFYPLSALEGQYTGWGVSPSETKASINLAHSWLKFKKKGSITVAVVDTGIEFNHPFLKDNIVAADGKAKKEDYGIDFSTPKKTTTPKDTHGHGTHVAGIIKSIFPEVKILSLKYYNPMASGQANLEATIKALEYAVEKNVDIINYSGGGPEASPQELAVLKKAEAKGILVIAAAGNEKSNIDQKEHAYYPASYGLSNIITVGAHDQNLDLIAASNWGAKSVDIAAPGLKIKSAIPNNNAGYMTGTSQATAFVTGVASLIKSQYPEFNYQQIKNIIISSSLKINKLKGKILGGGKLDANRALEVASQVHKKLFGTSRAVAKQD